jgi:hypothetical protein
MRNYSFSEIEAFAARFYGSESRLLIVPIMYSTTFLALAQNANASNVITIAGNADFVLLGVHHRAQIGAAQTQATKTAPFVRVLLTDSGSGENFMQNPVDLDAYSTNGNMDNPLCYPRIISAKSTITVSVNNYAPTAETYTTLDVVLEGVSVRKYSQ